MTITFDPLPEVLREPEGAGDVSEPAALLGALGALENPIGALPDRDQANHLFAVLYSEFTFIQHAWQTKKMPEPLELARWASLIRWFPRQLTAWRRSEDIANRKLAAIIIVAQASDWANSLWGLVPTETACNPDLIQRMKELIKSFAVTFSSPGGTAEPRWEREAVEQFRVADAEADWEKIGNGVKAFEHQIFPNPLQTQSMRCLLRCGMDYLVDALADLRQALLGMQLASSLVVCQRLRLAVASDNAYVQFGCLYQTLSGRYAAKELSSEEQQLLTTLLIRVGDDGPRWLAWMRVFNAYPMRHPILQVPLGHALAEVPEMAIDTYIEAIVLLMNPVNRREVAHCLQAFREKAGLDRRMLLWTRAHERWLVWSFDKTNSDAHLVAVQRSELDYAVVGFACECMTENQRTQAINAVLLELQMLTTNGIHRSRSS